MKDDKLVYIKSICDRISLRLFGTDFSIRVERDCFNSTNGRIFIQIIYNALCGSAGEIKEWRGRKWYLSDFMTEDEVVKTIYAAFELCVKHELMEGFTVDGVKVFNPHIDYRELIKISDREVKRS